MIQAVGRDAALGRPLQTGSRFAVAQHGGNADVGNGGIDDCLHIAAASGNQDDDVFHNGALLKGMPSEPLFGGFRRHLP